MKLYLTCGPSGSGKSFYYEQNKSKLGNPVLVCPDNIRKIINGNISDQSNGYHIWFIAYDEMKKALSNGENVYFSATFCNEKLINRTIKEALNTVPETEVIILRFTDGENLSKIKGRLTKDINNNIDRPNTLVKSRNGSLVVENQWKSFKNINFKNITSNFPKVKIYNV